MNKVLILGVLLSLNTLANDKSICGYKDNRILSNDPKIGRSTNLYDSGYCTITMIGKSCAVTAGHCVQAIDKIEFDVPMSDQYGNASQSSSENVYFRSKKFLKYQNQGPGRDWAVFTIAPHSETGIYPGEARGFYDVKLKRRTRKNTNIIITGYGVDYDNYDKSTVQQTATGKIISTGSILNFAAIKHDVDTMGGNSGASILNAQTNEVIGVHSHGGCHIYGYNMGTLLSKRRKFKSAVKACLDLEKKLK